MAYTDILKIVPTLQATALAQRNLRLVTKKKKRSKDFLKQGVENIVGSTLIEENAKFLNS